MSDVKALLGTWSVVSWQQTIIATGEIGDAPTLGSDPIGYLNYSPDGRMSAIMVRRDRPPPAALPTDEDKRRLFESMVAYAGTFEVNGDRVTHHIDVSWNQSWVGMAHVRFFKLNGDLLSIATEPMRHPQTGVESIFTVTWRRLGG
jgi:hypothetical protein